MKNLGERTIMSKWDKLKQALGVMIPRLKKSQKKKKPEEKRREALQAEKELATKEGRSG